MKSQFPQSAKFRRVLLSNDDGIDAPGMRVLEDIAAEIADEVWVVAPAGDKSGISRAISLHDPLRLIERGPRRFAVPGTPSDSVILGLRLVLKDHPPDLVLSGVNRGANIGQEIGFSGTVSAALTARMMGLRAVALSQAFRDRDAVKWHTAKAGALSFFEWIAQQGGVPANTVLNVNMPDVEPDELAGIDFTRQGPGAALSVEVETREDLRGGRYHWLSFRREPTPQPDDSDYGALRRQAISVTPVGFDVTDMRALDQLRAKAER